MKKRIAVLSIGAVALLGAATGCAEQSAKSETVDRNQEIAQMYAKGAPGGLAKVCTASRFLGHERSARMMANILDDQIIRAGGDVSVVIDDLLTRC